MDAGSSDDENFQDARANEEQQEAVPEEQKPESAKTEFDLILEEMQNDAILLEVEEMKHEPLSSVYNVLDMFNNENIMA